ncbi:chromosome segregation protein SMC [Gordonia sp. PDNC005]|uniref:chromosome segregation protein SMC n=1 Tax=unclassified Gordonia (in: high G+C Gram-positive bacteria) TaxID=2657482 RepID=UPI0019622F95|nr:chromosome segregation protein SMC [Gordonia sp. PDNC005]QRY63794.1 chromosome segregation protein SMC [Gordonia sp. PDNC005]
MHLKSLTLKGFKSFASSTTLRFEPGITCVVGPNGSGKSNVVDALTWVMGEQGAKALRGGKMADVIFAGTSGRAPLGRAEVTLTIDNSDGALPIEYSEVSVTRRMFRDGAGEYEINGNACRLMDVQELLSDSGIGREMHVIVGQGRLSAILESKPEDRRAFIEEAAGVLKHRRRREKAVRKLDAMAANLARLTDLTAELRRQLKPLGRQAEVARRAATVQADLRDARLRLAADDLVTRREEMAQHTSLEHEIRERQNEVAAQLDEATAALTSAQEHLAQITPAAAEAGRVYHQLSTLAERVDGTRRVASERAAHLSQPASAPTGPDPETLERQAEEAAMTEAEHALAVEEGAERLEYATAALQAAEQAASAAEKAHMAAVQAVADRREGLARLEGQAANLRTKVESVDAETSRLAEGIEAAHQRADAAQALIDEQAAATAALESREASLDEHHERCMAALETASATVVALQKTEREAEHAIASLTARIEALAVGLERDDGGAWLQEHAGDGLLGPLSDLLTVEPGYETAVSLALGPAADAIATVDGLTAVRALDALRGGDGGRAALIVGGLPQAPKAGRPQLPAGVVWARDVVTAPDTISGAVDVLLADTVIVDDAALGLRLAAEHGLVAVTGDGDRVSAASVEGGSSKRPSTLEVQSAVDTATDDLAKARATVGRVLGELSEAQAAEAQAREAAEGALAALNESDANVGAAYEQLGRLGSDVRSARDEADRLTRQRRFVEEGRADNLAALTEVEERLARALDEHDDPTVGDLDSGMREAAAAEVASARSMEVETRLTLRTAEERLGSVRGKAESLRRAAVNERANRERLKRQDASRRYAAGVANVVVEAGRKLADAVAAAASDAARGRDELEAVRAARTTETDELRRLVDELTATMNQLRDAVHRDEIAKAQAELRIEQLEEQVLEQFAMAPDDLVAEYGPDVPMPPSDLEMREYEDAKARGEQVVAPAPMPYDRKTQEIRAKRAQKDLTTLGKVNPLALEEFAALEERYSFLSTQLEDVKKARDDLLDVVADVDARILQVFTEAYADVEAEFTQVFATLFPGGEGRLVLTDPSDMLTTGVEVEARPPGKKVKRLSLLSGGEKSLTAVAMLVAIFRARPSPFYVMDEVEAALDDANLRRLISLFEQLREKSQLIVITHQKPTMEIADALYGVSMRGDGITQVISQRLRGVDLATAGSSPQGKAQSS